jgi:hypothetical protein
LRLSPVLWREWNILALRSQADNGTVKHVR